TRRRQAGRGPDRKSTTPPRTIRAYSSLICCLSLLKLTNSPSNARQGRDRQKRGGSGGGGAGGRPNGPAPPPPSPPRGPTTRPAPGRGGPAPADRGDGTRAP